MLQRYPHRRWGIVSSGLSGSPPCTMGTLSDKSDGMGLLSDKPDESDVAGLYRTSRTGRTSSPSLPVLHPSQLPALMDVLLVE